MEKLRLDNLRNNKFLFIFFFISFSPIFGKEYKWGSNYKVSIRQVSNFVSELKITETKTNKVFHESLTAMNYVIKTKRKKIGGKDIFFIQTTTGGEGLVSSNLYYFFIDKNELIQGAVEDIIEFSLRNLDKDKDKELILIDFKYYKFKVNNCYNALEPDPHYSGKLLPVIYKFKNNKFSEEKQDKEFLKNYLSKLETKLLKKKKFQNLNGYSHYYAIAKKIELESRALNFFKVNNSDFTYSCENTKDQNKKGKSFEWNTNYFDFFKKYGKELK